MRGAQHLTAEARAVAEALFPPVFTDGEQAFQNLRNLSSKALLIPTVMFRFANPLALMTLLKCFSSMTIRRAAQTKEARGMILSMDQ